MTTANLQTWEEDTTIQLDSIDPYDADETLEFGSSNLDESLRRMTAKVLSEGEAEGRPSESAPFPTSAPTRRPLPLARLGMATWQQTRGALVQLWRRLQPVWARALAAALVSLRRGWREATARIGPILRWRSACGLAKAARAAVARRFLAWRSERTVILFARLSPGEALELDTLARAWGCSVSEAIGRLVSAERARLGR